MEILVLCDLKDSICRETERRDQRATSRPVTENPMDKHRLRENFQCLGEVVKDISFRKGKTRLQNI